MLARYAIKFNTNGKTYFNSLPMADAASGTDLTDVVTDLEEMTQVASGGGSIATTGRVVGISEAVVDVRVSAQVLEVDDITDTNSRIVTGRMFRVVGASTFTSPFILKGLDPNFTEPGSLTIPPPGDLDSMVNALMTKYGWVGSAAATGTIIAKRSFLH